MNLEHFEQLKQEYLRTGNEPAELAAYKVDNAIILAAGISRETIYAPPKGLFLIDGVPIIERMILQLREAGIEDVSIVVGYKKEMYFYLEEKYGVRLIGNPRLDYNNIYSMYLARQQLKSTYICACDYYFKENPFCKYELCSYHGTAELKDAKSKFVVRKNAHGRITNITAGGESGECVHGIAYFDREFSEAFVKMMEAEIGNYRVKSLFWEEFLARHLDDVDLYARPFDPAKVLEFDELRQLKTMNLLFVDSVSDSIVTNICRELGCSASDINNVDVLDAGHSNITFKVGVGDKDYVYRYPGVSGKNIVNRARETFSNKLGHKLGIDDSLIFIDKTGHKLSSFVANAHPLDPNDPEEIGKLARLVRKLHAYELTDEEKELYAFDPLKEADRLLTLSCANKDNLFEIFKTIRENVHRIDAELKKDNFKKAVCHCNLNSNNCLITDHSFDLIDWEFSSYCDIAYDFPFLGNYDFRTEDLYQYLTHYYDREPTEAEYRHWLCYRAVHYWYYTCWAVYKESVNEDCGNLLLVFYEDCRKTVKMALEALNLK